MLAALTEAQQTGARLRAACAVIGISARTVARWQRRPNVADGRRGPRRRPANVLTPAEAAQVLTVMTSARYGHLSPKQLVPRLADAGVYLASESTMYRLRRRLQRHKNPHQHINHQANAVQQQAEDKQNAP